MDQEDKYDPKDFETAVIGREVFDNRYNNELENLDWLKGCFPYYVNEDRDSDSYIFKQYSPKQGVAERTFFLGSDKDMDLRFRWPENNHVQGHLFLHIPMTIEEPVDIRGLYLNFNLIQTESGIYYLEMIDTYRREFGFTVMLNKDEGGVTKKEIIPPSLTFQENQELVWLSRRTLIPSVGSFVAKVDKSTNEGFVEIGL
jgi:hypothetical protein